jgi:hypothetical protein
LIENSAITEVFLPVAVSVVVQHLEVRVVLVPVLAAKRETQDINKKFNFCEELAEPILP